MASKSAGFSWWGGRPRGLRHGRRPRLLAPETLEDRRLLAGGSTAGLPVSIEVARISDLDGNSVVHGRRALLLGQADPGAVVRIDLDGDGDFDRVKRAGGLGRFAFLAALDPGLNEVAVEARSRDGSLSTADLTIVRGDAVIAWNRTVLDLIRSEGTGPPRGTRALAMVHMAMLDAIETSRPAVAEVAAGEAAYQVLLAIYPERADDLRASRRESLRAAPGALARSIGIRSGALAGQSKVVERIDDDASAASTYQPGTEPGQWVPTPPKFLPGLAPGWGSVRGFALPDPAAFLPSSPPALDSAEYAESFEVVKRLGGQISPDRTDDQTALAHFWADLPGETFTPPGHWNQIAEEASLLTGRTLAENAALFAKLNVALADAAICCWGAKYSDDLWRPETAIQQADRDGNPATIADPSWRPLWNSPNFPAYTSGHSSFSGAAQVVLESEFGTNHAFTDAGDRSLGLPAREFSSFAEAADEAGISRIYGGIHFPFDNTAGLANGRAIGRYVVEHYPA